MALGLEGGCILLIRVLDLVIYVRCLNVLEKEYIVEANSNEYYPS